MRLTAIRILGFSESSGSLNSWHPIPVLEIERERETCACSNIGNPLLATACVIETNKHLSVFEGSSKVVVFL